MTEAASGQAATRRRTARPSSAEHRVDPEESQRWAPVSKQAAAQRNERQIRNKQVPHRDGPGRGRQAEARRNDKTLLNAARLVFAMHGPQAPVSAIAEEAGVGIGSLYRRYPTKAQLLRELCVESMEQQIEAAKLALADEGPPGEALKTFIRSCVALRAGVFTSIAGSIEVTDAMTQTAHRAHDIALALIDRAQLAGELRGDVKSSDVHLLIELFSRRRPDDEQSHHRLLEIAIDGLRAASAQPLPPIDIGRDRTFEKWTNSQN